MRVSLQRWLDRVAAMIRFGLARATAGDNGAAILEIDADGAALLAGSRGATARTARVEADQAGFERLVRQLAARGRRPRALLMRLRVPWVLQKRLVVPLAARRHLGSLLGFEMDRETPYTRDEVHWAYAIRGQDTAQGRLSVDLVIAPRALVDPLVDAARRAGLDPAGIEMPTGPNETVLVRLGERKPWQWLRAQRPLAALAAAACVLGIVAVVIPFVRQHQAVAAADALIASLGPQAEEAASLRRSADRIVNTFDFLATERERQASALAALAAATRAVPDDTYLTALRLHEGRLSVTGFSPSAAGLVGTLAKSPDFREPTFDSPVVQSDKDGLETFTISVSLRPAGAS
jgi:general secretion pathway protein L